MGFASVEEIETRAKEQECQLWETILHDDMTERQVDRLESIGKMSSMYLAMKEANESYDKDLKSQSGLSGGDGEKMMEEVRKMQNLTGEFVGTVMANALKMGESNACMKRIVAAPTAGACGVLPAVLITYEQFHKVPEEMCIRDRNWTGIKAPARRIGKRSQNTITWIISCNRKRTWYRQSISGRIAWHGSR